MNVFSRSLIFTVCIAAIDLASSIGIPAKGDVRDRLEQRCSRGHSCRWHGTTNRLPQSCHSSRLNLRRG